MPVHAMPAVQLLTQQRVENFEISQTITSKTFCPVETFVVRKDCIISKKWGNVPKVCLKNLVEPFKPSGRCFSPQNIENIQKIFAVETSVKSA
jgi:hypothetical protein